MSVRERVTELKEELKEARDFKKLVPNMRERDEESEGREAKRGVPGQDTISVPFAPPAEHEDDHPDVRFWNRKDWTEFEARMTLRNDKVHKLGFLCNASGMAVSTSRLEEMTEAAKIAWNELHYHRLDPSTWTKRTDQAMKYFSATMTTKFPEFSFCKGDWKLQEFAKTRYPDWVRYYQKPGTLSRA